MTPVQILTQENILKLEKIRIYLEVCQENIPTNIGKERLEDINQILKEVKE